MEICTSRRGNFGHLTEEDWDVYRYFNPKTGFTEITRSLKESSRRSLGISGKKEPGAIARPLVNARRGLSIMQAELNLILIK